MIKVLFSWLVAQLWLCLIVFGSLTLEEQMVGPLATNNCQKSCVANGYAYVVDHKVGVYKVPVAAEDPSEAVLWWSLSGVTTLSCAIREEGDGSLTLFLSSGCCGWGSDWDRARIYRVPDIENLDTGSASLGDYMIYEASYQSMTQPRGLVFGSNPNHLYFFALEVRTSTHDRGALYMMDLTTLVLTRVQSAGMSSQYFNLPVDAATQNGDLYFSTFETNHNLGIYKLVNLENAMYDTLETITESTPDNEYMRPFGVKVLNDQLYFGNYGNVRNYDGGLYVASLTDLSNFEKATPNGPTGPYSMAGFDMDSQRLYTCQGGPPGGNPSSMFRIFKIACEINSAEANPSTLWPPNKKWATVTVSVDTDCQDCTITSVHHNEEAGATTLLQDQSNESNLRKSSSKKCGNGNDYQIVNSNTVKLCKERDGNGQGRTYTIQGSCQGESYTVTVEVPHDMEN